MESPNNKALPNLKGPKGKGADLYRVNRKVKIKDEDLPFTNSNLRVKSPTFGNTVMLKTNDVLSKTYYNVAHPPNRNPLSQPKTQYSLATTCEFVKDVKSTKYCKYSEDFIKAQQKYENLEEDLNNDISKSIKRTSSVADYYKNYGFFYLTKTSQNFANTIKSLANYDRSAVGELTTWQNKKIELKKKEGSDYKQAIQHDKTIQDSELLLRNKMVQQSELLEATNTQLKSVLKQKAEMFQPGKSMKMIQLNPSTVKQNSEVDKKSQTMYNGKLPNILSPKNQNTTLGSSNQFLKNQAIFVLDQVDEEKTKDESQDSPDKNQTVKASSKNQTEKILNDDVILRPFTKKQMWELKEKSTTIEVKLQYTVIKLEEQRDEMKKKLEGMRMENCSLSEMIKNKYASKLQEIRSETEFQTSVYSEGFAATTSKSKSSPQIKGGGGQMGKASKVEDFMKIKAIRDQLAQKREKVQAKIKKCYERIQNNIQQIHMMEFEVEQIKKDITTTKQEQVQHYSNLLKEGIDSRKDGLIWIIKALWILGEDALIDNFPQYLDSDCIKFLLEYAKLDIKRSELHNMLKDMKFRARQDRINQVFKHKTMNNTLSLNEGVKGNSPPPKSYGFFSNNNHLKHHKSIHKKDMLQTKTKEEIMRQAKEKLHSMAQTLEITMQETQDNHDIDLLLQLQEDNEYQSEIAESEDDYNDSLPAKFSVIMEGRSQMRRTSSLIDIDKIQDNIEKGDEKTLEIETQNLEKRYNHLKNKMKKLKQEELERIGKEFLLNNYQKRFKVHQEIILAAIVGEDKAKSALANQMKKMDEYKRIVEKNRTFTFSSLRQTTTLSKRSTMQSLNKM